MDEREKYICNFLGDKCNPECVHARPHHPEDDFYNGPTESCAVKKEECGYRDDHPDCNCEPIIANSINMLSILKDVEWVTDVHIDGLLLKICPVCREERDDGHAPDCKIDAALKAARGEK